MSMIAIRLPASCAALLLIAAAPPDQGRVGYVIDGDTFRLESGERIRIAGIDAAETQAGQAKCRAEIALGRAATARARMLLDGRTVTIMRVGRSYNRTVARVTLAGRDVGSELASRAGGRAGSASPTGACAHADEDKGITAPRPA